MSNKIIQCGKDADYIQSNVERKYYSTICQLPQGHEGNHDSTYHPTRKERLLEILSLPLIIFTGCHGFEGE